MMDQSVSEFMTKLPRTISSEQSLEFAESKMHELGVRHLPVLYGGNLMGILSDRDIKTMLSLSKEQAKDIKIEDVMSDDVFEVEAGQPLKDVCETMAERKIGSALVMENGKLAGIFTWIDALNAIKKSL